MQIKSLLATVFVALVAASSDSQEAKVDNHHPAGDSSLKPYFISFADGATHDQFNKTLSWLSSHNIKEDEKAFQGYVKYIVAPLNPEQVKELSGLKESYGIEELEEDVFEEDSKHDEL